MKLCELSLKLKISQKIFIIYIFLFQFREQESSTAEFGFRIEALRVSIPLFIFCEVWEQIYDLLHT